MRSVHDRETERDRKTGTEVVSKAGCICVRETLCVCE